MLALGECDMAQKRKTGRPTKTPDQKDTADKIFDAAIDLFSQRGYDRVSIRDIAAAVGIKESSIYKHYSGKEEILKKVIAYPLAQAYVLGTRDDTTEQLIVKYGVQGFMGDADKVFAAWMSDPTTLKVLRIFYIEMYHNEQIKKSFTDLIGAGEGLFKAAFSAMVKHKLIKPADPAELSAEFMAFFWKTFAEYFLVWYGATSSTFTELYGAAVERHVAFFMKILGEKQ
jgi:AcrR family transcriptional regulator